MFHAKSEEVGEALLEHVITKYCIPEYIIMDEDNAFMSSLMTYLFHRLDIKIKTIAPFNHQSLQAEHGIKYLYTYYNQTSYRCRQDVDKVFIIGNVCVQHF